MAEETSYPNLAGKRVSTTFRGLLHLPHSIPNTLIKQTVYDGQGTPTALTLGADTKGADISGPVSVSENITIGANSTILSSCFVGSDITAGGNISVNGNMSLNGNISLNAGGTINDVTISNVGSPVSVRSLNTAEVGKLRIRESANDHELLFGNPTVTDNNLFSIIVKKDTGNNLYIKNNYGSVDTAAPLWINRATGEVNIKLLRVTKITTDDNPDEPPKPPRPPRNSNTLPVGMISMFPALVVPDGWFMCNGGSYSKITYPELFAYLGYAYGGSGDSFNVPDYRGYFLRAWGVGGGVDPTTGRTPGNIQTASVPSNTHWHGVGDGRNNDDVLLTCRAWNVPNNGTSGSHEIDGENNGKTPNSGGTMSSGSLGTTNNIDTTSSGENHPVNIAVAYCIKW